MPEVMITTALRADGLSKTLPGHALLHDIFI